MRREAFAITLLGAFALAGCSHHQVVPLLETSGVPVTSTPKDDIPLEVVTRATAIKDPLPVSGADVEYVDLEAALGLAVSTAAAPWGPAMREKRKGGFQLTVEIMQADVQYTGGRLMMVMNVNATLRTRVGRIYLAQTHANCRQAGVVEADHGGPIVYACMQRIGRDLGGWIGGLQLSQEGGGT